MNTDSEYGGSTYQEYAEIVHSIFRWFTEDRLPIGSIVSQLASCRIPSPSGNLYWSKAQIAKLLKNRSYIGETLIKFKASQEQVELPDATPAIIDKQVFCLSLGSIADQ